MPLSPEELEAISKTSVDDDDDRESTPEERGDIVADPNAAPAEHAPASDDVDPEPTDLGGEAEPAPAAAPAPEAAAPAEGVEPAAGDEPTGWVPAVRLNTYAAKLRAASEREEKLQARLQELEQAQAKAQQQAPAASKEPEYDFDAAEEEAATLLLDGDVKGYRAKRAEIRAKDRELVSSQSNSAQTIDPDQIRGQLRIEQQVNETLREVYSTYPIFDQHSPDFNEKLAQQAVRYRNAFIAAGETPAVAILEAVDTVVQMNGLGGAQPAQPATPAKPAAAAPRPTKPVTQPPASTGDVGTPASAGEIDIGAMTDEEFDALPESKLRELRGDARVS